METRLEILEEKKFVGRRQIMSMQDNQTYALWSSFMPHVKKIPHRIGSELYSIEIYPAAYFENYHPEATFEKWAAVEISSQSALPEGMESLNTARGRYAVFVHRGPASTAPQTYQYIFGEWLPASGYQLDHRPHFAIMGEQYKNDDLESEEELWIPVKPM